MSEKRALKESWSTDLSPQHYLVQGPGSAAAVTYGPCSGGQGGGVPGVWDWVGTWRVLYWVLPSTLLGPIFSIFLRLRPTQGQMKAILSI